LKFGKRLEIGIKNTASAVVRRFAETPVRTVSEPPQRILFIRYGGIGDMILSLPVFRAARKKYPDAEIDVLCDPKNAGPLLEAGLADNIALYRKFPDQIVRLAGRLRKRRYDYICNLVVYPSFTFGMLARLMGPHAIRAAGDQEKFAYFYNREINLPPKREIHMLDRLFLLAADITGPEISETDVPWATYPDTIQQQGERIFAKAAKALQFERSQPRLAAINLSAGLTRREWPLDKYAEFLRAAVEHYTDRLDGWVILTDPGRPGTAIRLRDMVNDPRVVVLPPVFDFRVMMEFMRHIEVIVTPDTSFSHAASAMGTPILNLMIGENVTTWAPVGVPHKVVRGFEELMGSLIN